MGIRRLTLLSFFLLMTISSMAQYGILKGTVKDSKTGEPLVGATILIKGTTTGTTTDFDGNYQLPKLQSGTYIIRCSFISYETQFINDIQIRAKKTTTLNFKLKESVVNIGNVQVVGHANRESESILLLDKKKAQLATQAIGAEEISRKGASNAEAAVTKVSGISKQEGVKNVFVRGLGDRFNSTSLNGFPISAEDPEYKNISLDFFSSDMLQSIQVAKVFDAGIHSADVGGAEINIKTKELNSSKEFKINVSGGINTNTYNHDFLKLDGVSKFGYTKSTGAPSDVTQYSFTNSLDPSSQNFQMNTSLAISGGKKYLLGAAKNPLKIYLLGSYSSDYMYTGGKVRNTTTTGTVYQNQDFDKYSQTINNILMATATYSIKNVDLSYNGLYIHSNNQSVGDYLGKNSDKFDDTDDANGLLRRQQIDDNSILVNQLEGKWKLSDRLKLDLGGALNKIHGQEPDRRMNYLSLIEEDTVHLIKGSGRQQRYFSNLKENDYNFKAEAYWQLSTDPNNKSNLHAGYNGRFVHRTFTATEYDETPVQQPEMNINTFQLDEFYNQENLDNGYFELDQIIDKYSVDKTIHSGFAELTYPLNSKLTGMLGLRADHIDLEVDFDVNDGGDQGQTSINEFYLLPSLSLKYDLTKIHSFRLGLSETYTLPQAKEISPFRYVDVSFKSQGNEDIQVSKNYNADLGWDCYLSGSELLSLSGYFKYIADPISRVEENSAGGFLTYDNISDHAIIGGIEAEIKKNLFQKGEGTNLSRLSTDISMSYNWTTIKLDTLNFTNEKSKLEGAAPFIISGDLSWQIRKTNFSTINSLVFNYFSDRIYTIGTSGFQDIQEQGLFTCDFISSFKLKKHWGISLKIKNILDPSYKLTRKPNSADSTPIILNEYRKGQNISLGIAYHL